jgi:hypothetical protein
MRLDQPVADILPQLAAPEGLEGFDEEVMSAITGIPGKAGGALAATLLAAGLPVRAIVRDATKGVAWAARGCARSRWPK